MIKGNRTAFSPCLLPDTKLRKNIIQQIIRGDLSGDLTEVMKGMADVLGQEVVGDLVVDASHYVMQGVLGVDEALVVAGIRDYYIAGFEGR